MNLIEWIQFIISISTLIAIIVALYKFVSEPDIDAKNKIKIIENSCNQRHKVIDDSIENTRQRLHIIQENHLSHIEKSINDVFIEQANTKGEIKNIYTILDERLPRK